MSRLKKDSSFYYVRLGLVFVYTVLFALYSFIPFKQSGADLPIAYSFVAYGSIALLLLDVFWKRHFTRLPYVDVLLLFFVACVVSTVLNIAYGFVDNIKLLMWMAVQMFLVGAVPLSASKSAVKLFFKIITNTVILIQTVGAVWSLIQFITGVGEYVDVPMNGVLKSLRIGFVDSRLFGVFVDPNYACICSLTALGFIVYNWKCSNFPKWTRLLYAAAALPLLAYTVLSGSRTGLIAVVAVAFLACGFLVAGKLVSKNLILRGATFIVVGTFAAFVSFGLYQSAKTGLTYLPGIYSSLQQQTPDDPSGTPLQPDGPTDTSDSITGQTTAKPTTPPPVSLDRDDLEDDFSNNRFEIWADCLKLVEKSPLFGTGPRTHLQFAEDHFDDLYILQKGYSIHNGYLALFVGSGLIGGCLMLVWLVLVVVRILSYLFRNFSSKDEYYCPIFICTCILIVHAISAFPLMALFFSNQISDVIFWLTLGFTFAFMYKSEPERYQKRSLIGKVLNALFRPFRKKT